MKNFVDLNEVIDRMKLCDEFYKNEDYMLMYGVGNHGGGPTIHNIELMQEYNRLAKRDRDLIFANPADFFADYKRSRELPVYKRELQHHASGCYSVVSEVKRLLRCGETSLCAAENFFVLALSLLGKDYDTETLFTEYNK